MKKILIYLALTIGGLLILARTAVEIYHTNRNLENPNSVQLVNSSNLLTEDLRITWNNELTIYQNGVDTRETYKEYGDNVFRLFYGDSLLAEFYQFKSNNWHGNQYSFDIQQMNDSLTIELSINGPDTLNVQRTK